MEKFIFTINGMMCGGCENRLKNRLIQIDGIENVEADHNTGRVVISSNGSVKKEDLENAIIDLGYDIVKDD